MAPPTGATSDAASPAGRWGRVLAGQSVSLAGAFGQQVALGYLALRSGGPLGVAVVMACRYLPALSAPWAGRWADRRSRRRVLRQVAAVQLVLCLAFAAVVASTTVPLWGLCVFAAVYALGATVDAVCATPVLVDRAGPRARDVVARMTVGANLARVLGAAAAAVALGAAGPAAVFALNAASFVALLAVLGPDPSDHTAASAAPAEPVGTARWWAAAGLWPVSAGFVVFAAGAFQPAVLWPVLGDHLLGGATGIARLSAAAAAGTVVGGLAAVRSPSLGWRPPAAGYLVCGASLAGLALVPRGGALAACTAVAAFGAGAAWSLAKVSGTFAHHLAPALRSRAQGWYRLLLDGTGPLAGLAVAAVSAWVGPPAGAAVCAGLAGAAAVVSALAGLTVRRGVSPDVPGAP